MATKRTKEIKLRLNEEEFETLAKLVADSGLSREKYMRAKLFGYRKKKTQSKTKKEEKK